MRMKKISVIKVSLASLVIAFLLGGCASYNTDKQAVTLPPVGMTTNVFKPNYELGKQPVSATAVQKHFLFFDWGDADLLSDESFEGKAKPEALRLQKAAVTKACLEADCDKLVGASFQFQRTSWVIGSKIICTVRGFPAKVVSVEEITPSPVSEE